MNSAAMNSVNSQRQILKILRSSILSWWDKVCQWKMTAGFIKPKMKYYFGARTTNSYFKVSKFLRLKQIYITERY